MKRILVIVGLLVTTLQAQTTTKKFEWKIVGPTLVTVQAYTYRYYLDGNAAGVQLTGVVCTGTASPFTCTATIPAIIIGSHVATMDARNAAGTSGKSNQNNFVIDVAPAIPTGFRIVVQ